MKSSEFAVLTGRQLLVLHTGEFVGDVSSSDIHFQSGHPNFAVGMVEEVLQDVVDGSFGHDELLEIFRAKLVAKLIHGADEERLDLTRETIQVS